MSEQKFWAVWRKTGGSAPSKKHPTKEEAINEAHRLAKQTGEEYFVLETIGVVVLQEVPTRYTSLDHDCNCLTCRDHRMGSPIRRVVYD